jgi:enoyl-CoA hydratase/carnithine racemase
MTFNGFDAKFLKLADHVIDSEKIELLNKALLEVNWTTHEKHNHQLLSEVLNKQSLEPVSQSTALIKQEMETIKKVTSFDNIIDIFHAIVNESSCSQWFNQAQKKLSHGSPLSAHIIYYQLMVCQDLTVSECFEQEFNLSMRCCQFSEFTEGVRALLVDKDKKPQWFYKNIQTVESKLVDWFFTTIKRK